MEIELRDLLSRRFTFRGKAKETVSAVADKLATGPKHVNSYAGLPHKTFTQLLKVIFTFIYASSFCLYMYICKILCIIYTCTYTHMYAFLEVPSYL